MLCYYLKCNTYSIYSFRILFLSVSDRHSYLRWSYQWRDEDRKLTSWTYLSGRQEKSIRIKGRECNKWANKNIKCVSTVNVMETRNRMHGRSKWETFWKGGDKLHIYFEIPSSWRLERDCICTSPDTPLWSQLYCVIIETLLSSVNPMKSHTHSSNLRTWWTV